MRVKRLLASIVLMSLTSTAVPGWAADEAVSPPAAGAAPTPVPTPAPIPTPAPTPKKDATPPAASKEAPKDVPPASVTILSAREAHGVLGRDVRSTTDEDMRAAAAQLATVPQRLIEMVTPYLPVVGEDSGDPPTTG